MATKQLDFSNPEMLQTRDGRSVRIYATDAGGSRPIHGAVLHGSEWQCRAWMADGKFGGSISSDSCDLILKTQRVRGWLNVYPRSIVGEFLSETKERAMERARGDCIGQVFIDLELET